MNRVHDYLQFTAGFVGLGYIVLWPLTAHDNGIAGFDLSVICGRSFVLVNLICDPPYELRLSPGLHLLGLMSAVFFILFILRLLLRQLRRLRFTPPADEIASNVTARALMMGIQAALRRPFAQTLPPPRAVKPRTHFGLRGVPH